MNELEAKCYLTKKGGANNSDHTCTCEGWSTLGNPLPGDEL